jgi:hypothetical protein
MICLKKVHTGWFSSTLLLLLIAIACAPTEAVIPPKPVAPNVPPPATAVPAQVTPKQPAMTGKVIFQDDFKDSNSGWTVFTNDFGEGKYDNGSYLLSVTRSALPSYKASTTNPRLTSLTSFMLDMDVTMLSGSKDDHFGIVIKWPNINPMGVVGYEQPSPYYFMVAPASMGAWCYTKGEIENLTAEKAPGYFLRRKDFTCIKGLNEVNNIKLWFNPNVRFLINDYELFDLPDENMDFVNRLIKDNTMKGGSFNFVANTERAYATPSFRLNRIAVYAR